VPLEKIVGLLLSFLYKTGRSLEVGINIALKKASKKVA